MFADKGNRACPLKPYPPARIFRPMPTVSAATPALTVLSEEESMFRDAVREFAETEIRPHVHAMDEAAQFRPELIPRFFELGLMGIEVPPGASSWRCWRSRSWPGWMRRRPSM